MREVFLPYLFYGCFFLLFAIGSLKTAIKTPSLLLFIIPVLIMPVYLLINMSGRLKE